MREADTALRSSVPKIPPSASTVIGRSRDRRLGIHHGWSLSEEDIINLVLKKNVGVSIETKPRNRYEDDVYRGPQSHISAAVGALKNDDPDGAGPHIESLADEPFYDIQFQMLSAQLASISDDGGKGIEMLRELEDRDRVATNWLARFAVSQLKNDRINRANTSVRLQNKALREKNKRQRDANMALREANMSNTGPSSEGITLGAVGRRLKGMASRIKSRF